MKPLNDDSKRIIEQANAADVPAPSAQAEAWQRLAGRLGEPLPPTAAAASQALTSHASGALVSGLAGKLLIGALMAGVPLAGVVWYAGSTPRSMGVERPVAAAPVAVAMQPAAAPPVLAVTAEPAPAPLVPSNAVQPRAASSLLAETRLIAAAQRALNSGDPTQALSLLDEHRAHYRRGKLAQERDAARVLSLCALGRNAEAERERQRFARSWRDSPLLERVRSSCE